MILNIYLLKLFLEGSIMKVIDMAKMFINFLEFIIGFIIAEIVSDYLGFGDKIFSFDFVKRVILILISYCILKVFVIKIMDMRNKIKEEGCSLQEIKTNIILMVLGAIVLLFEFTIQFNDILGWIISSAGVILIGEGILYKYRKPITVLVKFFKKSK